jgi:hypothetical protein
MQKCSQLYQSAWFKSVCCRVITRLVLPTRTAGQVKGNKTEKFAGGESLRGHGPSQSTGVLSRASHSWISFVMDTNSFGIQDWWLQQIYIILIISNTFMTKKLPCKKHVKRTPWPLEQFCQHYLMRTKTESLKTK